MTRVDTYAYATLALYKKMERKYVNEDGKLNHSKKALTKLAKSGDNAAVYLCYMEGFGDITVLMDLLIMI